MSKHYLIYGHGGAYNHGAEAITRCTINLLRQYSPGCHITLSTHFPEQDREFGLMPDEFVTRDINGKTNAEVYRTTLNTITPKTVAIHVGGDNYCYKNWERYALISDTVKECGGTSILWGCSISPEMVNKEMLYALARHDLILARESLTFQILKRWGLKNVWKVCDIAFTLAPKPTSILSERAYVILNLSPLACSQNVEVLPAMRSLLDKILWTTDFDVILLPHVTMPVDNDLDVLRELYKVSSNRVKILTDNLCAAQYKDIISKAVFCIAARTHVCIAAYSSCVPCIAVGYSTKAHGIAYDLDMSNYVVDCTEQNFADNIQAVFEDFLSNRIELHKKLEARINSYRATAVIQEMTRWI